MVYKPPSFPSPLLLLENKLKTKDYEERKKMLSDKNPLPEIPTIQERQADQDQETATMNSSSFFNDDSTTNTTTRFSKIKPTSLFGFSKILLPTTSATTLPSVSAPAPNTSPSHPFLRCCVSDLGDPLPTQVAAETPQSPQSQNANMVCPGTPLSAAKFPPIPSTLRRSISNPNPSAFPTFSSSCDGVGEYDIPNAKVPAF